MSTAIVTHVFCDRCNQMESLSRSRGVATFTHGNVAVLLRKAGWRRYWNGTTNKAKRPIECPACIADGKATPAPLFAAGGGS